MIVNLQGLEPPLPSEVLQALRGTTL